MNLKIQIKNNNYTEWFIVDIETNEKIIPNTIGSDFDPIQSKLFSEDVFFLNKHHVSILYSPTRSNTVIPGILLLEGNKTYGRSSNKKHLLYKCIPDNKELPHFLIPYELKLGFSKNLINKYIVFQFKEWSREHPIGSITETIGNVDLLNPFYEYQLYCKNLHVSNKKMIENTREYLKQTTYENIISKILEKDDYHIMDRTDRTVFSIDPLGSTDFDDAFSVERFENGNTKISIYIANVFVWLETLSLWDSFSKRVATIYLPDQKRTMLPPLLSDSLCSLQENQLRFAFVMDILVDSEGNKIDEPVFENVLIKVSKNYVYEDTELIHDNKDYIWLWKITQKMEKTSVRDSHDLVAYYMVLMNTECAYLLEKNGCGIFRSSHILHPTEYYTIGEKVHDLDSETRQVVQNWANTFGEYQVYSEKSRNHQLMQKKCYTHMTSPIRRLVDLLNQLIFFREIPLFQKSSTLSLSENAKTFLEYWTKEVDSINQTMRSIRKVQIDCELMNRCFCDSMIMKTEHPGTIFDKREKKNGMFSYMVYLQKYKLLSRITLSENLENYRCHRFRIFLFEDENKITKKIRLQWIQ